MTRTNKILVGVITLLSALSLSFGVYKYVLKHDYFVYMHAPCEVGGEFTCFTYEEEGEVSDPYLKVYRKAYEAETCVESRECDPYACRSDEVGCLLITCDEESLEEGESCAEAEEEILEENESEEDVPEGLEVETDEITSQDL